MNGRMKLFSVASLVLSVCIASIGALTPSAMAEPSYQPIELMDLYQIPAITMEKYAIIPTEERTYIDKPRAVRFNYKAETSNIAITHFVKGGGVTYTHGGKAVATS